jgi:hypothetical protein
VAILVEAENPESAAKDEREDPADTETSGVGRGGAGKLGSCKNK